MQKMVDVKPQGIRF